MESKQPFVVVVLLTFLLFFDFELCNGLVKTNYTEKLKQALEVTLFGVSDDSAEIDWHGKDVKTDLLSTCKLVYGSVEDQEQVEVSNFIPTAHTFTVGGLQYNVTYHFHMICYYNNTGHKLESNTLRFTTGPRPRSKVTSLDRFQGNPHSVYRESIYRDEDSQRTVPSFNVILGAVCGIVGFLIINVTVVIAVRRYSHRQMRRRRILALEERDYDFPYFRGYE